MKEKLISMLLVVSIGVVFVCLSGCSQDIQSSRSAMPGSNAYFKGVTVDEVFSAAKRAISQYYKIGSVDNQRMIIVSRPEEYRGNKSESSLSDTVSPVIGPSHKSYRSVATIKVRRSATGEVVATVRVEVQRRDTEAVRAFAYQREAEDRPSEVPIEQTTVRTGPRYEVWTTVRRDYNMERAILKVLKELLAKKK